MSRAFWLERIEKTKALITAYDDAVLALGLDGGVQSYTLDTGQSRQTVTSADIPSLNRMISSLENKLATLEARVYGGATQARPDW